MANEQNLTQAGKPLSTEEAQKLGTKGGVASGKARREKKAMKDTLATLLSMPLKSDAETCIEDIRSLAEVNGKNITVQDAIMLAQIKKAVKGDTKAATFLRDTSGNKLKEALEISGSVNNPLAGLTTEELRQIVANGE